MYRLMLYYLIFLVVTASVLSFIGIMPYSGLNILLNALYMVTICRVTNDIFAWILKVKTNPESALITGLILSLIMGSIPFSLSSFWIPAFAGMIAMISKYLIVWRGRHIFNPAAFGAVASALILGQGANWWIGSLLMLPAILLGGLLVLKKLRRWELIGTFLSVYILLSIFNFQFSIFNFLYSPILFFALVMLVEPLTSPVKRTYQVIYSAIVAISFFLIPKFLPGIFYGLEASLLLGNIFAFLMNKSFRQVLTLKKKEKLSNGVYGFWFEPLKKFEFKPGQFLEWTLSHKKPDNRGIRRFFTIASSPTEDLVLLASKFYDPAPDGTGPSTFKQALKKLEIEDEIVVSDLSGEFTLPEDINKKLVFIAGGIGITPFRSMIKWMLEKNERRNIVLLYSNKTAKDTVFKDLFKEADKIGLVPYFVNTDIDGYIDEGLIKKNVPDWQERMFYVSGPEPMVASFGKMLGKMGIAKKDVKRDYFPGYSETYQK